MVSNKRALCVGINKFQNYPSATLQGCVNDANDMEAVLTKYWGFASSDIVKLTDSQATMKSSRIGDNLWIAIKERYV